MQVYVPLGLPMPIIDWRLILQIFLIFWKERMSARSAKESRNSSGRVFSFSDSGYAIPIHPTS